MHIGREVGEWPDFGSPNKCFRHIDEVQFVTYCSLLEPGPLGIGISQNIASDLCIVESDIMSVGGSVDSQTGSWSAISFTSSARPSCNR
jgi:hypothetical protein